MDESYDEGAAWTHLLFAAIREVVPREIAREIVGVQPMPMSNALMDLLRGHYAPNFQEYGPDEDG